MLLGERLNRPQMFAIFLAIIAVAILTWDAGGLPWVSLALTFSWGAYAYFKKTLPVGPTEGFLLEILILAFPRLATPSGSPQKVRGISTWTAAMTCGCSP